MNDKTLPAYVTEVSADPAAPIRYSLCTLVTNRGQYADMVASFVAAGFGPDDCEFLYLDNSAQNRFDGYRGLNHLIAQARGQYVILCHQDVLAIDGRATLDACLADLDTRAPDWAVAGNAGYDAKRRKHMRITHRYGINARVGDLPAPVDSLDENFLLVRRDAMVGFSHDLAGFHFYGTDLVIQAQLRGFSAWAIDFHLEHLGHGKIDHGFLDALNAFQAKYARALRHRSVRTPVTKVALGGKDLESTFRKWKTGYELDKGAKPLHRLKRFDFARRKLALDLRDRIKGPRYDIDGATLTIPAGAPPQPRKALLRGTYEGPERALVAQYLPADLPVIELGGSYGIVSHAIRQKLAPGVPQIIVEANPALIDICRNNAALAGQADATHVINAALAYGDSPTVQFEVTEGIHNSHVAGDSSSGGTMTEVPAVTLSGLLAEYGITGAFSLVCDIEGAELSLLENDAAALARCACVVMELHPPMFIDAGASVSRVMNLFTAAGLQVVDQRELVVAATQAPR